MRLPDLLRRRVTRAFGSDGESWLAKLPDLLDACIDRWSLENCEPSPVMSYNYVCLATTAAHGPVALKIGHPHPELDTEIQALRQFDGRYACRLIEHDTALGALLLERLVPGVDLTTVPSGEARMRIAADLAARLPKPVSSSIGYSLPRVADWTARAFARARREGRAPDRLLRLLDVAEQALDELESPAGPLVLLHGDLNHWNILRAGVSWRAIDPKGAIGVPCFEAGRFILNELALTGPASRGGALGEMLATFAAAMGEPQWVVAACAFVDCVLSTCWSYEEHPQGDLEDEVDRCVFLGEAYGRLHPGAA